MTTIDSEYQQKGERVKDLGCGVKKKLLLLFSIQRVCKINYNDFAKSRIL
jgi:hypothetical protein